MKNKNIFFAFSIFCPENVYDSGGFEHFKRLDNHSKISESRKIGILEIQSDDTGDESANVSALKIFEKREKL